MDLPEYKKWFSARPGEHETEENIEGDPISEGLPPLRHHGGHGPEGELSSHLRGMPRKKKKKEGALSPSLPVASERRRGKDRDGDLHQQSCYRHHQLSPPLCSGVFFNLSSPQCNLYLSMVLNSIYFLPMIYDYPMMFE